MNSSLRRLELCLSKPKLKLKLNQKATKEQGLDENRLQRLGTLGLPDGCTRPALVHVNLRCYTHQTSTKAENKTAADFE